MSEFSGRQMARFSVLVTVFLVGCGAPEASEWTTLQGNARRTNHTPVRVEPPYKVRWVWANGEKYDASVQDPPAFAKTWLSRRAQPVTDGKRVYVGSLSDGVLFAIDLATGKTKWRYKAGAPMLSAATVADGKVYIGDLSGKLHCVNAATGTRNWVFEEPVRGAFFSNPLVADGKVIIGSQSGWLYALSSTTGRVAWKKNLEAPVFNSAAYHKGHIFVGDEAMYARKIAVSNGAEVWKLRLHGWTMRHSAPVISARNNLVIWRTCSIHNQYSGKAMDDALTLDASRGKTRESDNWARIYLKELNADKDHPELFYKAQEELRKLLLKQPHLRTFFMVDIDQGTEPFVAPTGYAATHADVTVPPVAFPDGRILGYYRPRWGSFNSVLFASRYLIDIGTLNLETKYYDRLSKFRDIESAFSMRGDDNSRISAGGEILFGSHNGGSMGAIDLRTRKAYPLHDRGEKNRKGAEGWKNAGQDAFRELKAHMGRNGHGVTAPAIAANGTILVNLAGVLIAAVESANE